MARRGINQSDELATISHAAVGILSLCTVKGGLDGDRLKALRRWLKPSITPFRSAHAE
jgi:hypothetical protein